MSVNFRYLGESLSIMILIIRSLPYFLSHFDRPSVRPSDDVRNLRSHVTIEDPGCIVVTLLFLLDKSSLLVNVKLNK